MSDWIRCEHPTSQVMYHHEIADDDSDYEEYWCRQCGFWLTPGAMQEIRERNDWDGGQVEP